jgi:hypothetical protein
MKRLCHAFMLGLLASWTAQTPATAALCEQPYNIGSGRLPITFEPSTKAQLSDRHVLVVKGRTEGAQRQHVVVRIDDAQSKDYNSRVNIERDVQPGALILKVPLKGLRTPNGRTLDIQSIRQIIIFSAQTQVDVSITSAQFTCALVFPEGVQAYAFGDPQASLPPGFERIAVGDPRISGENIRVIRRPGGDPLLANGLSGIASVRLNAPRGRTRVTLWTEDPGEWEYYPHHLKRSIRINGIELIRENFSPADWLSERYLRGFDVEHSLRDDAWTAYGLRRGDRRSMELDVLDDGIVITLEGEGHTAQHLAGVLLEPALQTLGVELAELSRADWYRTHFQIAKSAAALDEPTIRVHVSASSASDDRPVARGVAAPGTGVRLTIAVTTAVDIKSPRVSLEAPSLEGVRLKASLWAGQWRLRRTHPSSSLLELSDEKLVASASRLPVLAASNLPRHYEIWVDLPKSTGPGVFRGEFELRGTDVSVRIPIEINVLALELPTIAKPAGFYLENAPHLNWFDGQKWSRDRQKVCDLEWLHHFGIFGNAPALADPFPGDSAAFMQDVRAAHVSGETPGWLAYTPVKTTFQRLGTENGAKNLGRVLSELAAGNLSPPVWSVADEPSNPGPGEARLDDLIRTVREHAPSAIIAGHLNSKKDYRIIGDFDVVIINEGFGMDRSLISQVKATGPRVWLYNTGSPRLTAGYWLWATDAERYIQWHARMPTALPGDPTDGREADIQMFYPTVSVCPEVPDINRDVLRMADGLIDQRWLAWLTQQQDPEALKLLAAIRRELGETWLVAKGANGLALAKTRASIVRFANKVASEE